MHYIWLVALREIQTMVRKPSFYLTTFAIPLFAGVLFFGTSLLNVAGDGSDTDPAEAGASPLVGFVDHAGVISTIPQNVHQFFVPFADEASAAAATRARDVDGYFVIPPDYLQTGRVIRVGRQASISAAAAPTTAAFETMLRANLIGDAAIAARLGDLLDLQTTIIGDAGAQARADEPLLTSGVAFGLALLLAFSILNGGGWLVQAVAEEKENRTIELLLTSLKPWHLLTGKLLGLGLMSLVQLAFWIGLGQGVLGVGSAVGQIRPDALAPGVWAWVVLFFLLGFLFFGSLLAGVGAIGATMREAGQMTTFLTVPMLAPLWFGGPIADQPGGVLAQVLSLIPFTAPVTMMLRLGAGPVPLTHILLSAAVLALCVTGAIWLAARLFRATTLLTGAKPTPRVLWRAVRYSAS